MALVIINQSGLLKSDEILQRLNYSAADRVDALPFVHIVATGDSDNRGAWTLLPLFTRYQRVTLRISCTFSKEVKPFASLRFPQLGSNVTWILFMTENTRLNWSHLVRLTRQFDPAKVSQSLNYFNLLFNCGSNKFNCAFNSFQFVSWKKKKETCCPVMNNENFNDIFIY